jgi:hypothetical protein
MGFLSSLWKKLTGRGAGDTLSGDAGAGDTGAGKNDYLDLRARTFELAAEKQGQVGDGLVAATMEFWISNAPVTLLTVHDGTTSLYFGSGGGIIGAGQHASVQAAAGEFLDHIAEVSSSFRETDATPYPAAGRARFYAIRPGRFLTAEASEAELRQGTHSLARAYALGHQIITAVRLVSPG